VNKRKSISKKVRFEIFKRDNFACQYCGSTPPSVILEIDHIHPVSKGGTNSEDNLVTSCFDCNRGKSATSLKSIPKSLSEKSALIKEKESQLKAYRAILKSRNSRLSRDANRVDKIIGLYFNSATMTITFKEDMKRTFLSKLSIDEVENAMHIACARMDNAEEALRYFCGICWRRIKGPSANYWRGR